MTDYGGWDFGGRVRTNPDPNSQAAARSVEPFAPNQRAQVWRMIRDAEPAGLATWEVEERIKAEGGTGLHQSVSATFNFLWRLGAIIRVGKNRTPSGRLAYVHRALTVPEHHERKREQMAQGRAQRDAAAERMAPTLPARPEPSSEPTDERGGVDLPPTTVPGFIAQCTKPGCTTRVPVTESVVAPGFLSGRCPNKGHGPFTVRR